MGDPLKIPAATFNAMIDAARDHQQRHQGREQTSFPAFRQSGIVLARNDSGSDRDRFDVLGIDPEVADSMCCGNVRFRHSLRRRPERPPERLPQVKR